MWGAGEAQRATHLRAEGPGVAHSLEPQVVQEPGGKSATESTRSQLRPLPQDKGALRRRKYSGSARTAYL